MRPLILILLTTTTCFGADYYIDPDGDDARDGLSPQAAWKTLGRVEATTLDPGDWVLLGNGRSFTGPSVLRQPGSRERPIGVLHGHAVPAFKGMSTSASVDEGAMTRPLFPR